MAYIAARATHRLQAMASHVASGPSKSVGRLTASDTALVVCDIQERFRPVISGMPAVIDAARRMVRGAVALQMPVVVTEQYPKALGNTVEELKGILPEGTLVQDKFDFTMMVDPVKQRLKELTAVRKVLLLGIEAHVCVFQTVVDLLEDGYEVHLVVDAVSSKRPSDRATAIQRIVQMGGLLVSSEMALFQLCGSAKHPAFKAISALAKEDRPDSLPLQSNI